MCSARTEAKLSGGIPGSPSRQDIGILEAALEPAPCSQLDELIVDGSVKRAKFGPLLFLVRSSHS
jgi:hypothetical protein